MMILGLIPARGGSKGISRKNISLLGGKPMLAYTCQAALNSQRLTRILLNTDDPEIAAVGKVYGIDAPFLRPVELAQDDTHILPVIQHTLEWLATKDGFEADVVVLLQPTSPMRKGEHIDAVIDMLCENEADTVVSVMEVPHQFNPTSLMIMDDGQGLRPFFDGPMILRRQDKPRVYARNGPAVLAIRRSVIERGELYGQKVLPCVMDRHSSIDIDDVHDLELAEYWLNKEPT